MKQWLLFSVFIIFKHKLLYESMVEYPLNLFIVIAYTIEFVYELMVECELSHLSWSHVKVNQIMYNISGSLLDAYACNIWFAVSLLLSHYTTYPHQQVTKRFTAQATGLGCLTWLVSPSYIYSIKATFYIHNLYLFM